MTKYGPEKHKQICLEIAEILDNHELLFEHTLAILGDLSASVLSSQPHCIEHNEQIFFNMITEQTMRHVETLKKLKKDLK